MESVRVLGRLISALLLAAIFLGGTAGSADARRAAAASGHAQVYLLRGLVGFSHGMDGIAARLAQRGVRANLRSHGGWTSVAEEIAAQYRSGRRGPVILVGHSLGGDAAMLIAERLNQARVPVRLIITFDTTSNHQAGPNVGRVVNYYLSNGMFGGVMRRGPNFAGALVNMDMKSNPNISHTNIDQTLQNAAVASILQAAGR